MRWRPFRNFGLKTAALALGTLLWFTVSGHQIERGVTVPLSYSGVPSSLEMTGDQFDEVNVHVRGDDNLVSALTPGMLRVNVDLRDAHEGANLIPLRTDEVAAPFNVKVMQVDPGTVAVTLAKSGSARVAVKPTVEGAPASGYVLSGVTADPATATVEGPEDRLKGTVSVITERIGIDGRSSTFTADVNVGVVDSGLRLREPRTVKVTVRIDPAAPAPVRDHSSR